jgi:hypothetical protein
VAQVAECLPSECKGLSSTTKNKKENESKKQKTKTNKKTH